MVAVPIVWNDLESCIVVGTACKLVMAASHGTTPTAHVNSHDMLTDQSIAFFFSYISDEEYHIESGQNGGHEVDIFRCALEFVVPTKHRIGRGQNGRSGIQYRSNAYAK